MASLIGSLFVSLTADFAPFQRNMKSAEGVVSATSAGMRRSMGLTEKSVSGFQRSMRSGVRPIALISAARAFDTVNQRANLLRGALFATTAAFGGLGAALTSNVVSRYLDSFTGLENQIRVVSDGSADLAAQIGLVGDVAARSRSSLQATAQLYSRLAKAKPEEGALAILRRVETVSKALQLGGATAQESASAAIQFSQAIASNRLGGEELRAVLETPLGLELAKGLGVTIGEMRKLGFEGKLTADVLFKALDKISGQIDSQFVNSVQTIDQALTYADGKITLFAGNLDKTYGITRLLTGAIRGFADNLETIVPILAAIGIGFGSIFGGRLAGGFAQSRYRALKAEIDGRRENLRLAKDELAMAKAAADEAENAKRQAATLPAGGLKDLAPRSAISALKREELQLSKIESERLGIVEQQMAARQALSRVTVSTTTSAIKAADAVVKAETAINSALGKRWSLSAQLARVDKGISALPRAGVAPDWLFPQDVAEKERTLLASRAKIARELAAVDTGIAKNRENLAKSTARLSELETTAEQKAATQRMALKRQLIALDQQSIAVQQRLEQQRGNVRGAVTGVNVAGQGVIDERMGVATKASDLAATAAARARGELALAARAASGVATALGLARVAGMSLVGFLGGPWGVAFTGAIALVSLLAARSQAAAQTMAEAQEIIAEKLGQMAEAGNEDAQAAVLDKKIAETERQIGVLADATQQFADRVDGLVINLERAGRGPRGQIVPQMLEAAESVKTLTEQLQGGQITLEEFTRQFDLLAQKNSLVASLRDGIIEAAKSINQAQLATQALAIEFESLNGQRATLLVEVGVIDPLGVFSKAGPGMFDKKNLVEQYSQYGRGRVSARDRTQQKIALDQMLAEAGEPNKVKNGPAAVAAKEQELLEQGIASTREEASRAAKQILDLEEKTRLAGQTSSGAAKEYENFANKLAELQENASGAFLSELDQKVLGVADNLKNGSKMMQEYIAAVNSGDLSKAPKELLKAREALMQIGAADTYRGIIQQYGTGTQLASQFADKQAELNYLIAQGKITAEQAGFAYGEFIGQFGNYAWIDQVSSAITNFAESAITDFDNIGDAALSLVKEIGKIILQLTVLEPLKRGLTSFFGGQATGVSFGGGGFLSSLFGGLFGGGGSSFIPNTTGGAFFGAMDAGVAMAAGNIGSPGMASQAANVGNVSSGGSGNVIEVVLSKDLQARILQEAAGNSVRIVEQFSDNTLPGRVHDINQDPRAR